MLAAYGFFYGIYRERIDAAARGDDEGESAPETANLIAAAKSARSVALCLGILSLVIWLVFLVPVWEELEAAADVCFSFDHYSALDIVFVILASVWLPIAFILLRQATKIQETIKLLGIRFDQLEKLET